LRRTRWPDRRAELTQSWKLPGRHHRFPPVAGREHRQELPLSFVCYTIIHCARGRAFAKQEKHEARMAFRADHGVLRRVRNSLWFDWQFAQETVQLDHDRQETVGTRWLRHPLGTTTGWFSANYRVACNEAASATRRRGQGTWQREQMDTPQQGAALLDHFVGRVSLIGLAPLHGRLCPEPQPINR
jgi:hypothetical protein